jgi:hypothetical protein
MIDKTRTIILNGQEVATGWDRVLAEAQDDRTYSIAGEVLERIPFGQDYAGESSDAPSCRDCAAARGQLHVPICCLEQCPCCGGQSIGCNCVHDEDLEDDDGEVQE